MSNSNHILKIEGMSCTNCALGIERHLKSKGLESIKVNFSTKEVIFSSNRFKITEIENFIKSLGYKIIKEKQNKRFSIQEKLFLFCLIFTTPLFLHMFIESTLTTIYNFLHNPLVQFSLCLPVYITGTWFFGKSALGSIKSKSLNMDVLITIGSSAAFIYSIYGWYLFYGTEQVSKFLFFETSATIITLVLLGNVLEKRSVKQTTTSIKELSKIKIIKAKIEKNNKIIEVNFEEIKTGDILIINSGDKIAVDGKILQGEASIDESMITGESIPVFKKINDNVIGGTIIENGNLKVIATKVGEDTVLSNIIHLVKNAQSNKPRIQKIGDKISSIFVPVVLIISISTFLISYYIYPEVTRLSDNTFIDSILRAIAVLVISCPCAMGLATPTAVMVGIGRAAKNGILIKGGNTLEKLGSVKQIFFDKTGTITTGNFKIKNINIYSEDKIEEIKNIIYNLEAHSSHPIALSLQKELYKFSRKINLIDIYEEKGVGISAKIKKDIYKLGSYRILENQEDKHDIYLTRNNNLIASIDIIDELKKGVPKVILNLKKHKIITTLIS